MATLMSEPTQTIPIRVREDTIYVAATRVPLDTVIAAFLDGATLEEIVYQYPSLQLADVYAVVGYYLHHREEMDAYHADRVKAAAKTQRANESRFLPDGVRARLLARRANQK